MHIYALSMVIASVAMVLAFGSIYLCYDSWQANVETLSSLASVPWDNTARWADGLERIRVKTVSTYRLSYFALCCVGLAAMFTLTATVRLCEDKSPLYRTRAAKKD